MQKKKGKDGFALFSELVERAAPKSNTVRTGNTAKISGSKSYCLIPTVYKKDTEADPTCLGLPCGSMADKPFLTGPSKKNSRLAIRSLVFDDEEEEEVSSFTQKMFDFGNRWESTALTFFHLVKGGHLQDTGYIESLNPRFPYARATPDAIWLDPVTNKIWCVEVKMPARRKVIRRKVAKEDLRGPHPIFANQKFHQIPANLEKEKKEEEEKEEKEEEWYTFDQIYVLENESKYPCIYVPQYIMEIVSTEAVGTKIVQLEIGSPDWHFPILSITDYLWTPSTERIFQGLHVYWSFAWMIVLRGRSVVKQIKDGIKKAREENDAEALTKWTVQMADFRENFPWPAPEKGKPDLQCVEIMPVIWHYFN